MNEFIRPAAAVDIPDRMEFDAYRIIDSNCSGWFNESKSDRSRLLSKAIVVFMFKRFVDSGETIFLRQKCGEEVSEIVGNVEEGRVNEEELNREYEIIYATYCSRYQHKH